jgi:membrane protein
VLEQIQGLVGEQGTEAVRGMLASATASQSGGLLATLIGFAMLAFGASGVFGELQDAMNTIWGVQGRAEAGILATVKDRFLSFAMILGVGFLLLVSLLLSAGLAALGRTAGALVPEPLLHAVNLGVSFAVIAVLFAAIFKILPDVDLRWRDVWVGAVVTSLLFSVGKLAIGLYIGKGAVASAYGAAGSLVVVLVWVYYSAQILYFGAELTKVLARRRGLAPRVRRQAAPVAEAAARRPTAPAWTLAGVAAVAGYLAGRTPPRRLVEETPRTVSTLVQVRDAVAAIERHRRGRRAA